MPENNRCPLCGGLQDATGAIEKENNGHLTMRYKLKEILAEADGRRDRNPGENLQQNEIDKLFGK